MANGYTRQFKESDLDGRSFILLVKLLLDMARDAPNLVLSYKRLAITRVATPGYAKDVTGGPGYIRSHR